MSELLRLARCKSTTKRRLLINTASVGLSTAFWHGAGRATGQAMAAIAGAGIALAPIAAQAHTDSLGYILTPGATTGNYDSQIVYGSWHSGVIAPEGDLNLYRDGSLIGTQTFTSLLGPVADGVVPTGLVAGDNYFYANGDSLTGDPVGHTVYNFQSVTFLDLAPGTYTFGYATTSGLSVNWQPSGAAIGAGTFTIRSDGTVGVPGVSPDIDTALTSYNSSDLGTAVNPVFAGGTLVIDEADSSYGNSFTIDGSGTSTLDVNGNLTTLSGTFSDADAAQPGAITFVDTVGGGEVTLSGVNTHTGGTTINSGTVKLAGDGTLGAANNTTNLNGGMLNLGGTSQVQYALVQSGGVLANGSIAVVDYTMSGGLVGADATINAAGNFVLSEGQINGSLTGNGSLSKIGTGTVILAGSNDYTGGTAINGGTLQVGDGGTTGSITGNVTNNGALVFDRSDTIEFAGQISGAGSVSHVGTGTVVLTGDSDYAGGTSIGSGTLRLGNGGTSGSIIGDVVNDGTLVFNRADTYDFAGVISGDGALVQAGSGATVLSGTNSYTGGTWVQAGTLSLAGEGNLGAADGVTTVTGGMLDLGGTSQQQSAILQTGGVISDGRANVATYSLFGGLLAADATVDAASLFTVYQGHIEGTLTGEGRLVKSGPANVVLSGTNDYTGGTSIEGGMLILGAGGTSGSITGDVVTKGGLAFNRSDDVVFLNAISGTGFVAQIGEGSTRLNAANTYEGGTFIANGTLIGSSGSFGTGPIVNEAALVLDQDTDATFANVLNGGGSLTKLGSGTLNLIADSSLTGPTYLSEGGLAVNALFAGTAVTVESGTVLSGVGMTGGLTVRDGGVLATGNDGIGTFRVAGDVNQNAGSLFEVQLAQSGSNDMVVASGTFAIEEGAILNVTHIGGHRFALDSSYTVLSADGGVSGQYTLTGDTNISAFFDVVADYSDPNAVVLNAVQTRQFAGLEGMTRNQIAAAGGAQSLGIGNTLFDAISYLSSEDEARSAFDQISGEIHASVKGQMLEDSRFMRQAVNARLRGATGGVANKADRAEVSDPVAETGISVWGHGFGAWGHTDGARDRNAATLDRSIGGGFMGADVGVGETWRIGAVGGYSHSRFDVDERMSQSESENYHVGLYSGGQIGDLAVRLGGAYSWHEIDTSRSVAFTGFADGLAASYDAQTMQAFGELAYRVEVNAGAFEPFGQLAHVRLKTNNLIERGGPAALRAEADESDMTFSNVGLRLIKHVSSDGATSVYGSMGWRHAFGDETPIKSLSFASGSDTFTVAGTPIARDAAALEAGISRQVARGLNIGVSYSGQISSRQNDHGFNAVVGWSF